MHPFSNKRKLLLGLVILSLTGLYLTIYHLPQAAGRMLFAPKPTALPAEVSTPLAELLKNLEAQLQIKSPQALKDLQPGLSPEAIANIEHSSGLTLPPDIKALYQWRNGQSLTSTNEIMPGHVFLPLEDAVRANLSLRATAAQSRFLLGHRKSWLPIFDDGASDGYFLEADKTHQPGHFFYHMAEAGYYFYFPSVKNFIAGLLECYSTDAIYRNAATGHIEEDPKKTEPIWTQFGQHDEL